jgi:hypothetical protein
MFVPLHARLDLPDGDTWERDGEPSQLIATSDPQPLLDLLQSHAGLIVLGDPGSGKTTFLKYLALQLAQGNGATLGLENWLPVVLPLAAYANALAEGALPLGDFFVRYYRQRGWDLPLAAILSASLPQGGVLFLLDGLDEVNDVALRRLLVSRVLDFFSFQRQSGNKFVLTSRLVGYRAVRQVVAGLVECTLLDLDGAAIEQFVTKWQGATGQGEVVLTAVPQFIAAYEAKYSEPMIPIIAGVKPLYNAANAEFLHNEVPGMVILEGMREQMRTAVNPQLEGVKIAQEIAGEYGRLSRVYT